MYPAASFFTHTAPTELYTLSLHDALPISAAPVDNRHELDRFPPPRWETIRSEEHTSELQSRRDLVCRLLLEKKNPRGKGRQSLVRHRGRRLPIRSCDRAFSELSHRNERLD